MSTKTKNETPKETAPEPAKVPTPEPAKVTPETPASETLNVTVDVTPAEIVQPLGERMPPVTEGASEPPTNETPASEPKQNGSEIRDAKGVRFDPFRHQTLEDGTPRRNAKGNFMLRNDYRLGKIRREGSPVVTGSPSFADPTGGKENAPPEDQFDAAAEVYLHAAYGPLQIAFGPDIKADAEDHKALKTAVANYLRATNATELSPGWALTITLAAFAAKKASVPTVQERAMTLWEKVRAMFGRKPKQQVAA